MKEHLKFAGKVVIALIIINAVTDLFPALNNVIYTPVNFVKGLFGKSAA